MRRGEKAVDKLCELIKEKIDVRLNPETFKKLYPSNGMKLWGAWSWRIEQSNFPDNFGSQIPVTKLVKEIDNIFLITVEEGYEIILQ